MWIKLKIMLIFDASRNASLGHEIRRAAVDPQAPQEFRAFGGKQHKARRLVSVRGEDGLVLSTAPATEGASVNHDLIRLPLRVAMCRDHGAVRVTVGMLSFAHMTRQCLARMHNGQPGSRSDRDEQVKIFVTKGHQMEIAKIMHAPAEWVEATTPVADVARRMKQGDIGALPVGKDDRLIGMITDRDLALRVLGEGRDPATTTVDQVMTPGIVWCLTTQTVEDAMHMMEQKKIRRLPVIDPNKRLVGMLSLGDIADAMPQQLLGEVVKAVADHHA